MKYKKLYRFNSYLHIVEIDPQEYRLDITEGIPGRLEKLSDMYGEPRLDEITWVRMNAQFFGGSNKGYGSFIDPTDDLEEKPPSPGYVDLSYKDGRLFIGTGGDFTIGTSYGLIARGQVKNTYTDWHKELMAARNPRSMAGYNGNNIFIVADGRWYRFSLGITADQQIKIGQELGCTELANFDGGGSSQLMVGNQILNKPSDGKERAIVSAIVAYRKYTIEELPIIRKGSKGVYVNLAQRILGVTPDGKFGPGTLAAVKVFQQNNRLTNDGVIGQKTWSELIKKAVPS